MSHRIYTPDFKGEAVRQVVERGYTVKEVAERLGLSEASLVRKAGPQRPCGSLDDVELAILRWVWWFNHHRLFGPIGDLPPAEHEEAFFRTQESPEELLGLN